jgi:hypothetical protein
MTDRQPTPAEIKRFKYLEKLMNPICPKPTDTDIERVISKLEERLAEKAINRNVNFAVKEGYAKSVELLKSRTTDLTKSAIGDLQTVQGRAIAMCAMDYLQGLCSEETLCGVLMKTM